MEMNPLQSITNLQYLALIHQVSYTNVCKEVGMTPQQFSDWVKKRRPVPKERLQALADFFKIEASLLIDENHYLQDLTPEMKIDIQILFINQLLENPEEGSDLDAYREKLVRLQDEKEQHIQISRFAAIVKQNSERTRLICDAFLDHIDNGNIASLEQILNRTETKE